MTYYSKIKKTDRPVSVPNTTRELRTHSTSEDDESTAMYVTVGCLKDKKPFEVFTAVGHDDPCERAYLEALSRCISLGLQYGVPSEEFAEQLDGIKCLPVTDPGAQRFFKSPADAIAYALREAVKD